MYNTLSHYASECKAYTNTNTNIHRIYAEFDEYETENSYIKHIILYYHLVLLHGSPFDPPLQPTASWTSLLIHRRPFWSPCA